MKTVGIIGFGSFGTFLAEKLGTLCQVKVYDPYVSAPERVAADLDSVCESDYVVLAIPLEAYESVGKVIRGKLGDTSVIVDISSVKSEPVRLLARIFPNRRVVVTHPLFGPQSAVKGLAGHTLVMCPEASDPEHYELIKHFCAGLGLKVVEKSAQDHDKDMAYAQGLTFFVARALMRMDIHAVELQTPSFRKLLELAELESHHSEDLFTTIQKGNEFTEDIRKEFARQIDLLTSELSS